MKFLFDKQEKYTLFQILEDKVDSVISPLVKSELVKLNAEGIRNIILDLSAVKYIDSSGLSALLTGNRLCIASGGVFIVAAPSEHVMKLIQISQLETVLNILPTKEEAIDAVFMHELEIELKKAQGEQ
jgi:anti-anti-sigma factor